VFRFSDNETNVVEHVVTATGIAHENPWNAPKVSVSNAPNPFAETIYDVRGSLVSTVADGSFAPGEHAFPWSVSGGGSNGVGSGVYFARITVGASEHVRKLIVVR
jgi:hypothetical protein